MGNIGVALLLTFALLGSSLAGTLGDFEDAVAKPHSSSSHSRSDCDDDDESIGNQLFNDLFGGCINAVAEGLTVGAFHGVKWLVYGWWAKPGEAEGASAVVVAEPEPEASVDQPPAEPVNTSEAFQASESNGSFLEKETPSSGQDGLKHKLGTAGLPYVRFDYRWQYLDSDFDANDYLLEAGYKYVALYGRATHYEDRVAKGNLDIEQCYGLWRIGGSDDFYFPGYFQLGLGIGGYAIQGDKNQGGLALTVPIFIYPADWCGIEFRPAWASISDKTISDYDVSVSAGQRFLQLRAGYRWLWVQGEGHWLNGPYAGVSASF